MDIEFFKGKKVLIMGLGKFGGGKDAAIFASKAGAHVVVADIASKQKLESSLADLNDHHDIEYHLGPHNEEDFINCDILIVNPAVPPESRFIQIARDNSALVTSQIEIFFQLCKGEIIGITGANGKSTTTSLTAHLLKHGTSQKDFKHSKVWLGGNIGNKPMLSHIEQILPDHLVVLEISSFQAEQLGKLGLAPKTSLITNITPNHLDRHGTFEAYCDAKENLFKHQKLSDDDPAISIFNAEDPVSFSWYEKYKQDTGRACFTFKAKVSDSLTTLYKLPGKANLSDLAAALTVAKHYGVKLDNIKKALPEFHALPHRLEFIAKINEVTWYNDSIATTPPSAIAALDAFDSPKIIILGGYDKHLPFDELGAEVAKKAKAAILLGQTAEKIRKSIDIIPLKNCSVDIVESLADAVTLAENISQPGDVVLLSPACASYDMFDNFQQRGEMFRKMVHELM